jgi:DNA-binding transcriptional LysR family regulator
LDKLRALEYFVASAEEGSFAGAHSSLGAPAPEWAALVRRR